MTMKANRRNIMRNVKRETGLPLPVAAKIAKLIENGDTFDLPAGTTEYGGGCGDPGCCGDYAIGVQGPKGTISFSDARATAPRRESKGMPEKVRTIKVKVRNVDAALTALRAAGHAAMIATGECLRRAARDGTDMVALAINTSGNQAHKVLVAAGVTPPASSVFSSAPGARRK